MPPATTTARTCSSYTFAPRGEEQKREQVLPPLDAVRQELFGASQPGGTRAYQRSQWTIESRGARTAGLKSVPIV